MEIYIKKLKRFVSRDEFLLLKGFAFNEDDGSAGLYILALSTDHVLAYSTLFVFTATEDKWRAVVAHINEYIDQYHD